MKKILCALQRCTKSKTLRHIVVTVSVAGFGFFLGWIAFTERKSPWEWLELLVIPAVLAIGGWWFTTQDRKTDRQIAKERTDAEAIQNYFDRMGELILEGRLLESNNADPISNLARTLTMAMLRTLNKDKKVHIVNFLVDTRLIEVVKLNGANLYGVDLRGANLSGALLAGANLNDANLAGAIMHDTHLGAAKLNNADLRGASMYKTGLYHATLNDANLRGAIVKPVQLEGAKSLVNATLPNGKKYTGELPESWD
jgi:hypothetical protein